jgi:undecaprenyl-phosphate 4-deoxy-4-formamido-L-arabinose transferase
VSVVVPVYNSATSLPLLIAALEPIMSACSSDHEIVLVNDGSRDESWKTIVRLAAANARVRGIDLARNYGQHNALLAGIRAARNDVTITMDDDLQHPADQIPRLIERLGDDCDLVYGTARQEPHSFLRAIASRMTKATLQIATGSPEARHVSAFRAFATRLREAFADFRGPYVAIDVLLSWATTRSCHIEVEHAPRKYGKSNYTTWKLLAQAGNLLTGFTVLPLQLASATGFVLTLFGTIVLGYVILMFAIHGRSVPGFAFLASIISIFSGAQLFALGIIGAYLARIHFRVMDRPSYEVREETGRSN